MHQHRTWPTLIYVVVCFIGWLVFNSPPNSEERFFAAIFLGLAGLPWLLMLRDVAHQSEVLWMLMGQAINAALIFYATGYRRGGSADTSAKPDTH